MNSVMQTERLPVIHIGLPKTATKTLQRKLFAWHNEIYYLGRFDDLGDSNPIFGRKYEKFDCCRNREIQQIMQQIAYGDVYSPDIEYCRELLVNDLNSACQNNQVPVWSWESYSTDVTAKRRVRASNLKQVFGDCRIIMTLRNPIELLESAYFQQLKRDNVGSGATFRPPYYASIDEWVANGLHGEIMPHLEYAETVQIYIEQFGRERVSIFLFEELCENSPAFFENLCRVIGVEKSEGVQLTTHAEDNSRLWTVAHIESLKRIKQSTLKSLYFRFSNIEQRKEMLGIIEGASEIGQEKARAHFSEMWQEKIYNMTAAGNEWLEKEFGLPLKQYGYRK